MTSRKIPESAVENLVDDLAGKLTLDYALSNLTDISLPSNDYIDLTAGASGSTYTAPANGWFSVYNASGQSNAVQLYNQTKKIGICNPGITGFTDGMTFVPAVKDDVVMLKYTGAFNSSGTGYFRFIYAKGKTNV